MSTHVLSIVSKFSEFKKKAVVSIEKGKEYFADRDAVLIGASTDSEFVHAAWRRDHAYFLSIPSFHEERFLC